MGLLLLDEIASLLTCPRCRAGLAPARDRYRCTNPGCPYSDRLRFPLVAGWPVLVDFERSILTEEHTVRTQGASVIPRPARSGLTKTLKELLLPPNAVARRNVARLRQLLNDATKSPTVLVVGGAVIGSGIDALYQDPSLRLIAFDIYGSPLTQFIADGHRIPLQADSVDAVIVQAVLQHVLDPWQVVAEIHRVLKHAGLIYAETPFMQQVHEGPYDFTRFTESGHRYLFKKFDLIDSGVVGGPGTQMLWSVDYVSRSLFRSRQAGKLFKALFFWLRYIDRAVPADYSVDSACGVFFLGRKADAEIVPRDMVDHYKGAQRERRAAMARSATTRRAAPPGALPSNERPWERPGRCSPRSTPSPSRSDPP